MNNLRLFKSQRSVMEGLALVGAAVAIVGLGGCARSDHALLIGQQIEAGGQWGGSQVGSMALPVGTRKVDAQAALARFKSLAGTWQSSDSDGDGKPDQTVRYKVIAGGSAVVEELFPGTPYEMITTYHLDGPRLMATHYCGAGNQPRLVGVAQLGSLTPGEPGKVWMSMVDVTNFQGSKRTVMSQAEYEFVSQRNIVANWYAYDQVGKPYHHVTLNLVRVE
jgi:hypothetical protein